MIGILLTRGTLHSGGKQCEDNGEKAIDKPAREASEEPTVLTTPPQTSDLQNREKRNVCCLSQPFCDVL